MMSIEPWVFKHPFTCMIAGPTQSGKTSILKTILENNQYLIYPPPSNIFYCYAAWQKSFDQLKLSCPLIEFKEGIMDLDLINPKNNNLLILDDLMDTCKNDDTILNLFTTNSHHRNISVFLITQNLFTKGKHSRTISLNSNYMIIMNNPRDKIQIECLARQMYPQYPKFLVEAYEDATKTRYGYLFIDLTQDTDQILRVQTGIVDDKLRLIYVPNSIAPKNLYYDI